MDPEEFEGFFRTSYPLLVRYAQRRFDPEIAEELASATLLSIWSKDHPTPKDEVEWRRLHAFAYRILDGHMKNTTRAEASRSDATERARVQEEVVSVLPDVADDLVAAQWPDWAGPLPLTDRDLLELLVDGYKVGEIALILGCSSAAVTMRLQRAKKRAKLLWQKEVRRGRS